MIFVCRFVFSGDEERTPQKNQKTPEPYRVGLSSPRGTPKGKKRGLFREDTSHPYSALEEPEKPKVASGEEKAKSVYIKRIIRMSRKHASIQGNPPYRVPSGKIHRSFPQALAFFFSVVMIILLVIAICDPITRIILHDCRFWPKPRFHPQFCK